MTNTAPTAAEIRAARAAQPDMRERDFTDQMGIAEAQLVAAYTGQHVTRIDPAPNALIPLVESLGEVMALTRNPACVHEKVGVYHGYHPGRHAAMVINPDIDLRIFPGHWCHGFMVEKETDKGVRRSIQIFDASGEAVHKIHLRDASDLAAWDRIKAELATGEGADELAVEPPAAIDPAKTNPNEADALRAAWTQMTDTHQFMGICRDLGMNRLGAYHTAGAPFAEPLAVAAIDTLLEGIRDTGIDFMLFAGNRGCIQIHTGPLKRLMEMGPWQNILDPGFDMHLRRDLIAELWCVQKTTRLGPTRSVEGFDAEGRTLFQAFPVAREGNDTRAQWSDILATLPTLTTESAQ